MHITIEQSHAWLKGFRGTWTLPVHALVTFKGWKTLFSCQISPRVLLAFEFLCVIVLEAIRGCYLSFFSMAHIHFCEGSIFSLCLQNVELVNPSV